jgi:hypothetical protein
MKESSDMAHSEETGGPADPEELHDIATQAVTCLSKLSTALAQAGAPDAVVQALDKMGEVVGKISDGLAKGMKEAEPEPAHTMDSAMQATMAERAAAKQNADAGGPPLPPQ